MCERERVKYSLLRVSFFLKKKERESEIFILSEWCFTRDWFLIFLRLLLRYIVCSSSQLRLSGPCAAVAFLRAEPLNPAMDLAGSNERIKVLPTVTVSALQKALDDGFCQDQCSIQAFQCFFSIFHFLIHYGPWSWTVSSSPGRWAIVVWQALFRHCKGCLGKPVQQNMSLLFSLLSTCWRHSWWSAQMVWCQTRVCKRFLGQSIFCAFMLALTTFCFTHLRLGRLPTQRPPLRWARNLSTQYPTISWPRSGKWPPRWETWSKRVGKLWTRNSLRDSRHVSSVFVAPWRPTFAVRLPSPSNRAQEAHLQSQERQRLLSPPVLPVASAPTLGQGSLALGQEAVQKPNIDDGGVSLAPHMPFKSVLCVRSMFSNSQCSLSVLYMCRLTTPHSFCTPLASWT